MMIMEVSIILLFSSTVLLLFVPQTNGQTVTPHAPTPTSSPTSAPTPVYVNLAHLLSVAGPYTTFLNYLESTNVIDTFQNQANNTEEGITIFVPSNQAFDSLKKASLSNLTQDQLKQLLLFHVLPHYYSLSDFKNLSQKGPVSTLDGAGQFALNFIVTSGTVYLDSCWTRTKVTSSIDSTHPIAVYQVDKVLLPEGTKIPSMPSPTLAPEISPAADTSTKVHTPGTSPTNTSNRIIELDVWSQMVLAVSGMLILFFYERM